MLKEPKEALANEKEAALELNLTVSGLRKLRYARKIPFIRISYRCVRYDMNAVRRALKKLEVNEII
jgi:hypothetical protein